VSKRSKRPSPFGHGIKSEQDVETPSFFSLNLGFAFFSINNAVNHFANAVLLRIKNLVLFLITLLFWATAIIDLIVLAITRICR